MQSADVSAPDTLDKYRTILSREFTSSDEEVSCEEYVAGSGNNSVGDEDGPYPFLRIRNLRWQSVEVCQFKDRLDTVYLERFATEKQRVQLSRVMRDAISFSRRSRPRNAPDWALNDHKN